MNKYQKLLTRYKNSSFIQQVLETFGTKVIGLFVALVTSVIVARLLGPEGRGIYAAAMATATLGIQFANLGIHSSNTYYLSKNSKLLPTLLSNSLFISLLWGGALALIAWVTFQIFPKISPSIGTLQILSLIWIPIGIAQLFIENLLIVTGQIRIYNIIEISMRLMILASIILLFIFIPIKAITVFIIALISLFIGLLIGLLRIIKISKKITKPSFKLFQEHARYAFKAYIICFLSFMVIKSDILIVNHLLGAKATGQYSVAATLIGILYLLPSVINTLLFPRMTKVNEVSLKWQLLKKNLFYQSRIMLVILLLTALLAKPAIKLVYGNEFIEAALPFLWLLPGLYFIIMESILKQFLNSIGMPKILIGFWLITTLINVLFNFMFIPEYGIKAAALVSSFSYFFIFLLVAIYIYFKKNRLLRNNQ